MSTYDRSCFPATVERSRTTTCVQSASSPGYCRHDDEEPFHWPTYARCVEALVEGRRWDAWLALKMYFKV